MYVMVDIHIELCMEEKQPLIYFTITPYTSIKTDIGLPSIVWKQEILATCPLHVALLHFVAVFVY